MSACETPQVQLSESTVRELVRLLGNAKIIPDADEQNFSTTVITIEHRRAGESQNPQRSAVETPYLTLDEAAAYCRCSPKTILNHRSLGNVHAMAAFFTWLAQKHPGWELPKLFVQAKIVAGCRTLDLCKVRTAELGADSLMLSGEVTKTRESRGVPLPAQLAAALNAHAGPVWLWERSVEESKLHRPTRKKRGAAGYKPSTWRWTIQNLFREFNESRPGEARLRPHDLRARAFTIVAAMTQSVDATAAALGANPQTARVYVDAAKAFDRSDILRQAAPHLLPSDAQPPGGK